MTEFVVLRISDSSDTEYEQVGVWGASSREAAARAAAAHLDGTAGGGPGKYLAIPRRAFGEVLRVEREDAPRYTVTGRQRRSRGRRAAAPAAAEGDGAA